jgi:hypothetical protein
LGEEDRNRFYEKTPKKGCFFQLIASFGIVFGASRAGMKTPSRWLPGTIRSFSRTFGTFLFFRSDYLRHPADARAGKHIAPTAFPVLDVFEIKTGKTLHFIINQTGGITTALGVQGCQYGSELKKICLFVESHFLEVGIQLVINRLL